jgi:hypothetical protein
MFYVPPGNTSWQSTGNGFFGIDVWPVAQTKGVAMVIDAATNNVGIGTTTPWSIFDASGGGLSSNYSSSTYGAQAVVGDFRGGAVESVDGNSRARLILEPKIRDENLDELVSCKFGLDFWLRVA